MPDQPCPFCTLEGLDRVFYRDDVIAALWEATVVLGPSLQRRFARKSYD